MWAVCTNTSGNTDTESIIHARISATWQWITFMVNLGINNTSFWPNFAILKYKMLAIRWLKTPFQTHNSSSKPTKLANIISHFTSITGYNLGAGKLYLPPPTLYLSLSLSVLFAARNSVGRQTFPLSSPARHRARSSMNWMTWEEPQGGSETALTWFLEAGMDTLLVWYPTYNLHSCVMLLDINVWMSNLYLACHRHPDRICVLTRLW